MTSPLDLTRARKATTCQACASPIVVGELYRRLVFPPWNNEDGACYVKHILCRFCHDSETCYDYDGEWWNVNDNARCDLLDDWSQRVSQIFGFEVNLWDGPDTYNPALLEEQP